MDGGETYTTPPNLLMEHLDWWLTEPHEQTYACTECGAIQRTETPLSEDELYEWCDECGEKTIATRTVASVTEDSQKVAELVAEVTTATKQQAWAYVLRHVFEVRRFEAANIIDCSASNVDNLVQSFMKKRDAAQRFATLAESGL